MYLTYYSGYMYKRQNANSAQRTRVLPSKEFFFSDNIKYATRSENKMTLQA